MQSGGDADGPGGAIPPPAPPPSSSSTTDGAVDPRAAPRERSIDCPRCGYRLHGTGFVGARPPRAVRCAECGAIVDAARAFDLLAEHRSRSRPPAHEWRAACRPAFVGGFAGLVAAKAHFVWSVFQPGDVFRGPGPWSIRWSVAIGVATGTLLFTVAAVRLARRTPGGGVVSLAIAAAIGCMLLGTVLGMIGVLALAQGATGVGVLLLVLLAGCVAAAATLDAIARAKMLGARLLVEAVRAADAPIPGPGTVESPGGG